MFTGTRSVEQVELAVDMMPTRKIVLQGKCTRERCTLLHPWYSSRAPCLEKFRRFCTESITRHNNEIKLSKRRSWKEFCRRIKNVPDLFKLQRSLRNNPTCRLRVLNLPPGDMAKTSIEILEHLMQVHFPRSDLGELLGG